MHFYPIAVRIDQKPVVIIGAGRIAQRKIKQVRLFSARVRVVAPKASRYVADLGRRGKIDWLKRRYRSSDIRGAQLVIAATSDRSANEKVSGDARRAGIWVNVVDHTTACEFIVPAVVRRGKVVVAVSTDGRDPKLSKRVKDYLKRKLNAFDLNRDR